MLGNTINSRWQLEELLGKGERGSLYLATEIVSGELLTVKLLPEGRDFRDESGLRYLRCLRRLESVNHPNLLVPLESGYCEGTAFLVTPYYPGQSLDQALKESPFTIEEGVELLRQAALGLAELHRRGVFHHNLKPSNLLVCREESGLELALTDPALSLLERPESVYGDEESAAYRAPEGLPGLELRPDLRGDLYSLGMLGHLVFTGRAPFSGLTPRETARNHLLQSPPDPRAANPELPGRLAGILARLTAKDPRERYQSAPGLLADLSDWTAESPPPVGARDHSFIFPAQAPLLGRGAAREAAVSALSRAASGRGAFFVVAGEPGSGKRRLFESLMPRIEAGGGLALRADLPGAEWCAPLHLPLALLEDFRRRWVTLPATRRQYLAGRLNSSLGGSASIITAMFPALGDLLEAGGAPPPLPPERERQRTFHVLAELFAALADKRHPLVLWLGHLENADADSLGWLSNLLHRLEGLPIVLFAGYSAGVGPAGGPAGHWLHRAGRIAEIHSLELSPLDTETFRSLTAARLGLEAGPASGGDEAPSGPAVERLADWMRTRWGGNPLANKLVLSILLAGGQLRRAAPEGEGAAGRWSCDWQEVEKLLLPDTLEHLFATRLAQLSEESRMVLGAASVFPALFTLADLSALLEHLPPEALVDRVEEAIEDGFLRRAKGAMTFSHAQLREHCHTHLPAGRREQFHRLLGALRETQPDEPPLLHSHTTARHFGLGGDTGRMAEHGLAAAACARKSWALPGAVQWYRTLLPLLGNDPRLPETLVALGRCHVLLGEPEPALDALGQAGAFDLPDPLLLELRRQSAWAEAMRGDNQAALEPLGQAMVMLGQTLPSTQMGAMLTRLTRGARRRYGELREAAGGPAPPPMAAKEMNIAELLEQTALVLAPSHPARAVLADERLLQMGASHRPEPVTLRSLIRLGEARNDPDDPSLREAAELARQHGFPHEEAEQLTAGGRIRFNQFDLRRGKDALFLAAEAFWRLGDPLGALEAQRWMVEIERLQGPGDSLLKRARHMLALAELAGSPAEAEWAEGLVAYGEAQAGQCPLEEATHKLKGLAGTGGKDRMEGSAAYFRFLAASLNLGVNRAGEAQDSLEGLLPAGGQGVNFWERLAEAARAELHMLQVESMPEDRDWHMGQARGLLKSLRSAEKLFPRLTVEITLLEVMNLLVEERPDTALELTREAAQQLDSQGARVALARLYFRLAEGLKRLGKKSWRQWGEKALAMFETAGAALFAQPARALLTEGGAPAFTFLERKESTPAPGGDSTFLASLLEQLEKLIHQRQPDTANLQRQVLRTLLASCGAEYALLYRPDLEGELKPVARISGSAECGEISRWLVDTVWREGRAEVLERFQIPLEQGESGVPEAQSALCLPLGGEGAAPVGLVYLGSNADRRGFDQADLNRLNLLARQAGSILAVGAWLESSSDGQNRMAEDNQDWERLSEWSGRAALLESPEELLTAYLVEAGVPGGYEGALIYWLDEKEERLRMGPLALNEGLLPDLSSYASLQLEGGGTGAAVATREKIVVEAAAEGSNGGAEGALLAALGAKRGLWLPLLADNLSLGALLLFSREVDLSGNGRNTEALQRPLRLIAPSLNKSRLIDEMARERDELREKFRSLESTSSRLQRYLPKGLADNPEGAAGLEGTGEESFMPIAVGQLFDAARLTRLGKTTTMEELRSYYRRVNEGVAMHQGELERILGHKWVASYEKGVENAIWGTLTLHQMLLAFQDERALFGSPMLRTGLGVHLGNVIGGLVESGQRVEQVMVGEGVQVASRLAGMCRTFRAGILISEEVVLALEDASSFDLRSLGMFRIGPSERRVGVFELYSTREPEIREKMRSKRNDWNTALRHYQLGEWREGAMLFRAYLQRLPHDRPARHYLRFCRQREARVGGAGAVG